MPVPESLAHSLSAEILWRPLVVANTRVLTQGSCVLSPVETSIPGRETWDSHAKEMLQPALTWNSWSPALSTASLSIPVVFYAAD